MKPKAFEMFACLSVPTSHLEVADILQVLHFLAVRCNLTNTILRQRSGSYAGQNSTKAVG